MLGRAVLNAFERRAACLSTALARRLKRMFFRKLEKLEKHFPVNWDIIIEYIHKHYIKSINKNAESLCNI